MNEKQNHDLFRIDYMVAVHAKPDGWPEEQSFKVVNGHIEKMYDYDYDFKNNQKELNDKIVDDIKRDVFEKISKNDDGWS